MQIAESKHSTWTVFALTGKLDQEGSAQLKAALAPHLGATQLALDFAQVEYVTSVGFRVLLQALKEQTAKGGRLLLGNMSTPVYSFFEIAGLNTTFKVVSDIYPTVATP